MCIFSRLRRGTPKELFHHLNLQNGPFPLNTSVNSKGNRLMYQISPSLKTCYLIVLLYIAGTVAPAQGTRYPEFHVGDDAPDFSLSYATKDSVGTKDIRLSSFFGSKNVVLAFYPADWSGGCTREMCTFRDNFAALGSLNSEVIAISGDYTYSHHEWAKQHNLPFILASDHRHSVAATYNSYNEDTGYNKRTVYVIDKAGKIAYIDLMYSTKDLASFEKLQAALQGLK